MPFLPLRFSLRDTYHRFLRIPYPLHAKVFQNPKKPRATYVFIHGIGHSMHAWDEVIADMPKDVRVIALDLLGFGKSPKPVWPTYNAKTQARSVAWTLLRMRLTQPPIIVGHSLGALVGVEVAKRYPLLVKELILCSPPFYKPELVGKKGIKPADDVLRSLYRLIHKHPEQFEKISPLAVKFGLANRKFHLGEDNLTTYMAALEASIINQTALADVKKLKLPITIFYGAFDGVVIGKHIVKLGKEMPNVTVKRLLVGHEILGKYVKSLNVYIMNTR